MPPKKTTRSTKRGGAKAKPMRKIKNAKQAYKKNVRNQMMLRRAGVVETKVRVDSDTFALNGHTEENDWQTPLAWKPLGYSPLQGVADLGTNGFTWIPLSSFTRISRGLGDDQMIGSNITSKYLKVKAEFKFPQGRNRHIGLEQYILNESGGDITKPAERSLNKMIQNNCKLYFICGWVTKHMGRPLQISYPGDGLLASQVTEASLARYVCDQIEPYFNDDTDKLEFRPRVTTNIRIEHYSRVKPNLTQAIPAVADPGRTWQNNNTEEASGSIPNVYKSYTFKTGRKLQMTLGTPSAENTGGTDTQNFYPNDNWLPFCIAYNPNYEELLAQFATPNPADPDYTTEVCQIQFRHNSAHYFTDG